MATLGQRVKKRRKQLDISQGQVAVYAQVNRSYISQIEHDHVQSVGSEILKEIARCLETTPNYLLGLTDRPWLSDNTTEPATELEYQMLDEFRKIKDPEDQRYALAQLELYVEHQQQSPPRIIGNEPPEEEK